MVGDRPKATTCCIVMLRRKIVVGSKVYSVDRLPLARVTFPSMFASLCMIPCGLYSIFSHKSTYVLFEMRGGPILVHRPQACGSLEFWMLPINSAVSSSIQAKGHHSVVYVS